MTTPGATSLERVRVLALARDHFGFDQPEPVDLPGAVCARSGDRMVVSATVPTPAGLGAAMLWADRRSVSIAAVMVETAAEEARTWLGGFESAPPVLTIEGRWLREPDPSEDRSASPSDPDTTAATAALAELCEGLPIEIVVEHGCARAEVQGLEVARTVPDGATTRVDVGVGSLDRAGHGVLSADRPVAETLAAVVDEVASHRRPGAAAHVLNRLARERWLRCHLVADPARLDLVALHPVAPEPQREGLTGTAPAPAVGTDADGRRVLVMASVGLDPGLAVSTAAVGGREEPDRVVVALPGRDVMAAIERQLARLRWPVQTRAVEPPWGGI